jgi:hypothetical protein
MSQMKNRGSNKPRREQRQVEAKARQEAYSKLSPAEKLAKLDKGGPTSGGMPYVALKQRVKLHEAEAAAKAPKKVEAPVEKAPQASQEAPGATQKATPKPSPSRKPRKAPQGR